VYFLQIFILFLNSEGARQQLEGMRNDKRYRSAVLITSTWRGWHLRRRWPALRRTLELQLVRPANNASKNANNGRADLIFCYLDNYYVFNHFQLELVPIRDLDPSPLLELLRRTVQINVIKK
jgi:hypothetical protein